MTEEKLAASLAQQMPDAEKRRRADFIVDSSQGFDHIRAQIRDILRRAAKMHVWISISEGRTGSAGGN
jgi:dephospho-CoA kinase